VAVTECQLGDVRVRTETAHSLTFSILSSVVAAWLAWKMAASDVLQYMHTRKRAMHTAFMSGTPILP
jgi:hypothetical protein